MSYTEVVTRFVFDCKVCKKGIETDGLACKNCGDWLHFRCIPMSNALFQCWFSKDSKYTFYCRTCYRGFEDYDSSLFSISTRYNRLLRDRNTPVQNDCRKRKTGVANQVIGQVVKRADPVYENILEVVSKLKPIEPESPDVIEVDDVVDIDPEPDSSLEVTPLSNQLPIKKAKTGNKTLTVTQLEPIGPSTSITLPLPPPGDPEVHGYPLTGFMAPIQLLEIIETAKPTINRVPSGPKCNVYYVINNNFNIKRRSQGLRSMFEDNCGRWERKTASTKPIPLIRDASGTVRYLVKKNNEYYDRINGQLKKLDPLPEGIIHMKRHYVTLERDIRCKRHVTWLDNSPYTAAVMEYIGDCSHYGYNDPRADITYPRGDTSYPGTDTGYPGADISIVDCQSMAFEPEDDVKNSIERLVKDNFEIQQIKEEDSDV